MLLAVVRDLADLYTKLFNIPLNCFASDGNGTQAMLANLVSEPFRRKVPWQEREDVDTLRQLRR
jgi:hypothetical protein